MPCRQGLRCKTRLPSPQRGSSRQYGTRLNCAAATGKSGAGGGTKIGGCGSADDHLNSSSPLATIDGASSSPTPSIPHSPAGPREHKCRCRVLRTPRERPLLGSAAIGDGGATSTGPALNVLQLSNPRRQYASVNLSAKNVDQGVIPRQCLF